MQEVVVGATVSVNSDQRKCCCCLAFLSCNVGWSIIAKQSPSLYEPVFLEQVEDDKENEEMAILQAFRFFNMSSARSRR